MKVTRSFIVASALGLSTLVAGAARAADDGRVVVEFSRKGVSAPAITVVAGDLLTYVNRDTEPHEAYSPDCRELSSPLLAPGGRFTARAPLNARSCVIQDLLNLRDSAYAVSVQIKPSPVYEWTPSAGG